MGTPNQHLSMFIKAGNADAALFLANLSALTEEERREIAVTALQWAAPREVGGL